MKNNSLEKFFDFKNKVVLITGCNGQIGNDIVNLFLDITKESQIKKIIKRIILKEKSIDIIINNAGVSTFTNFKKRSKNELEKIFNTNVASVINIIKNYVIQFDKKKLKKGKIINIGSIYGFLSPDFRIYSKGDRFSPEIYGATKSSIIQLTKYYAVLLADRNINVNCISPGGILNKKLQSKNFISKYKKRVPKKRMGLPKDLLTSIIYLSSDYSDYTTGQNIVVDGGLSLK